MTWSQSAEINTVAVQTRYSHVMQKRVHSDFSPPAMGDRSRREKGSKLDKFAEYKRARAGEKRVLKVFIKGHCPSCVNRLI